MATGGTDVVCWGQVRARLAGDSSVRLSDGPARIVDVPRAGPRP